MLLKSPEDFVAKVAEKLSHGDVYPRPPQNDLKQIILAAFYASMMKEERRGITFALAYVDNQTLHSSHGGIDVWCPFEFRKMLPFEIQTITKLAPAVDPTYNVIAIQRRRNQLKVVGLIRTSRSHHRHSRIEASTGRVTPWQCLVVKALGPGHIQVNVGDDYVASIERGSIVESGGVEVLKWGIVSDTLRGFARKNDLDSFAYVQVIHRVLLRLLERGHGGIVIIQKGNNLRRVQGGYHLKARATNLRDAVRRLEGIDLATVRVEASDHKVGETAIERSERLKQERIDREVKRELEKIHFLDDTADFAADLASIDGALVLQDDLTTLTFGARIECERLKGDRIVHALSADATHIDQQSPIERLGTRHNSAAKFSLRSPGSVTFVASEDGILAVMIRLLYQRQLYVWRPVALAWSWPFHTKLSD